MHTLATNYTTSPSKASQQSPLNYFVAEIMYNSCRQKHSWCLLCVDWPSTFATHFVNTECSYMCVSGCVLESIRVISITNCHVTGVRDFKF